MFKKSGLVRFGERKENPRTRFLYLVTMPIILDVGLVTDVKLQFPGLLAQT
jgi:hypothetical protein